ncbi:hypothetical protein MBLNU457_g0553t1 [Dothideomycetes sp. NU457]
MAPGGLFPVYQPPSVEEDADETTAAAEEASDEEEAAPQPPSMKIALDQPTTDDSASDASAVTNKSGGSKAPAKRAASLEKSAATTKKAKGDEKQKNQAVAKKSTARKPRKNATTRATEAASAGTKAKKMANIKLPEKYENANPADKFLFDNHEKGMSFEDITPRWLELAGRSADEVLSKSMLSTRYSRMKTNFSMIKEADHVLLFEAKSRVEAILNAEKWARVAADIVSNGGGSYTPDNLERCHKRLMQQGGDLTNLTAARDRGEADDDGDD